MKRLEQKANNGEEWAFIIKQAKVRGGPTAQLQVPQCAV